MDTEANGTLYLGHTSGGLGGKPANYKETGNKGVYIVNDPGHFDTYMCDGYIQDIAFIPDVVEGYGARLTEGPDARPAGIPAKLPTPFTWTRGPFKDSVKVKFESKTSGTQMYYTTDGSKPDATKTLYPKPFELTATTTVKALAYKVGHTESDVFEATFAKTPQK